MESLIRISLSLKYTRIKQLSGYLLSVHIIQKFLGVVSVDTLRVEPEDRRSTQQKKKM
jgi:hypothetical protein